MIFLNTWIYLLSLSLWVGGMVFFSFFATPVIFSTLPREMGSQVLAVLFSRYYQLGYVTSGLLLITTLLDFLTHKSFSWVRLLLVLILLGCTVYAGTVVRPKIQQIKIEQKAVEESSPLAMTLKQRFDSQHRLSVILNLIAMVSGLFLLGMAAYRMRLAI